MPAPTIHVLLVEDSPSDALIVREELAAASGVSFIVTHAARLSDALERLKNDPIDVVLADLGLPDSDGMETFARLQRAAPGLPIIILSGRNDELMAVEAVQAGAQDYLMKSPGEENGLSRAIRYGLERARTQEALRESGARFRQVVENIHEALWMIDADTRQVVWANPRYSEIWGRPESALRASPRAWAESIAEDDRDRMQQAIPAMERGTGHSETYRIVRPDGAVRWIRHRTFAARDGAGRVRRLIAVAEDTTEQKKLEEQFLRAQRLEAIGTLASGVAHDLNNILTPVLMTAELLAERAASPRDRELLAMMARGAQRATDTVRQLLVFSRGAEGRRGLVQLNQLLGEMAGIMRETFPREITIVEKSEPVIWPVIADATHLHQVLMNLCVNARDAMPEGGILTIGASNVRLEPGDLHIHADARPCRYAVLTVADTGHGIPTEMINRVFDPFFTTKDLGKGSGLGLSTALGIVRSHGGFLTVDSEPGHGTVFRSYLPAAGETALSTLPQTPPPAPLGRGELVLIVDDEPAIRETLREILELHQYRVLTAADGREAMSVFLKERGNVKLVLTDLAMPVMGGVALVRALRALDPDLKVIAASGLDDENRRTELAALGVGDVLMKPLHPAQLLGVLRRHLSTGRSSTPWEMPTGAAT